MAFALYAETHLPDVDIYQMSYWEIGIIDYTQIYQNPVQIIPDVYKSILDDEIGYLPHCHLLYWKSGIEVFWTCKYCSFWCHLFYQRIMEIHLLERCQEVCRDINPIVIRYRLIMAIYYN